MKRPTILVLGAGYGGLSTVVNLQKSLGADEADIVLINKNDYHYESTWLHEAAAGTLSPEQVRYDIKSVINSNKVKFVEAEVTSNRCCRESRNDKCRYTYIRLPSNRPWFRR